MPSEHIDLLAAAAAAVARAARCENPTLYRIDLLSARAALQVAAEWANRNPDSWSKILNTPHQFPLV